MKCISKTAPLGRPENNCMNRLYNLDYLRGLAALSIMIYHYLSWTFPGYDSGSVIGRTGLYGVAVFYVLSGLTMFHVYHNRMSSVADVKDFFKKRAFRIFPLLWLVIIGQIILSRSMPDLSTLVLNLTGLFGLVAWDQYIAVGSWSIGNELVFYLFIPVFIFLRKSWVLWLLMAAIFALHCYFAFYVITGPRLEDKWSDYVNPLNQVFLFAGGFTIGHLFKTVTINHRLNLAILFTAVLAFIFFPIDGDEINIASGWPRMAFTAICLAVCFSFYKLSVHFPKVIEWPLTKLGEACYSVYLVHPLVYNVMSIFIKNKVVVISISFPLTLVISYFVYQWFERYFIDMARTKQAKAVVA